MRMLAKRFKYLMMDERAALAARLIAAGGTFWAGRGGALTVAHSGAVFTLGKREAQQVIALLGVRPGEEAQRLDRFSVDPGVLGMVLEDTEDVLEAAQILPAPERGRAAQLA